MEKDNSKCQTSIINSKISPNNPNEFFYKNANAQADQFQNHQTSSEFEIIMAPTPLLQVERGHLILCKESRESRSKFPVPLNRASNPYCYIYANQISAVQHIKKLAFTVPNPNRKNTDCFGLPPETNPTRDTRYGGDNIPKTWSKELLEGIQSLAVTKAPTSLDPPEIFLTKSSVKKMELDYCEATNNGLCDDRELNCKLSSEETDRKSENSGQGDGNENYEMDSACGSVSGWKTRIPRRSSESRIPSMIGGSEFFSKIPIKKTALKSGPRLRSSTSSQNRSDLEKASVTRGGFDGSTSELPRHEQPPFEGLQENLSEKLNDQCNSSDSELKVICKPQFFRLSGDTKLIQMVHKTGEVKESNPDKTCSEQAEASQESSGPVSDDGSSDTTVVHMQKVYVAKPISGVDPGICENEFKMEECDSESCSETSSSDGTTDKCSENSSQPPPQSERAGNKTKGLLCARIIRFLTQRKL